MNPFFLSVAITPFTNLRLKCLDIIIKKLEILIQIYFFLFNYFYYYLAFSTIDIIIFLAMAGWIRCLNRLERCLSLWSISLMLSLTNSFR